MVNQFSWRLEIFANPSADKPAITADFGSHADLRRELIFVHGLDRPYVEHGLMVATSAEVAVSNGQVPPGPGFEFCKTRPEKEGERIVWVGRVTLIRRRS